MNYTSRTTSPNSNKQDRKASRIRATKFRTVNAKYYKEYQADYHKTRRSQDYNFKLAHTIRTLLYQFIDSDNKMSSLNTKKQLKYKNEIGYGRTEFINHIKNLGYEFGQKSIDHIIPLSFLLNNGYYDLRVICNLKNISVKDRKRNQLKYNYICYKNQLTVAESIEKEYPVEAAGLVALISKTIAANLNI